MKKFFLIFFFQITSLFGHEIPMEQLRLFNICEKQKNSNQKADCFSVGINSLKRASPPQDTLLSICKIVSSFVNNDTRSEVSAKAEYICIQQHMDILPYSDKHSKTIQTCRRVLANTDSYISAVQCFSQLFKFY